MNIGVKEVMLLFCLPIRCVVFDNGSQMFKNLDLETKFMRFNQMPIQAIIGSKKSKISKEKTV